MKRIVHEDLPNGKLAKAGSKRDEQRGMITTVETGI